MADGSSPAAVCKSCGKSLRIMKRCVQCQAVFYCSRSCQVRDWTDHKPSCLRRLEEEGQRKASGYVNDDKCIFADETDTDANLSWLSDRPKPVKRGHIDFQAAFDMLKDESSESGSRPKHPRISNSSTYVHENEHHQHVPQIDEEMQNTTITVKSNKEKYALQIQQGWNGDEIFKVFSCHLKIPLEKLKIIHKGKILTRDSICDCIRPKALFQVIGEKMVDDNGLNRTDIEIMMSQLHIERNDAVRALKKNEDLIDAILEAGNK